ncbi:MAG: hypothetical protein ABI620_04280 [Chloroflexota bacterium]
MEFTERELFTVLHGLVLGTLFLLAFGAVFASLYSFKEHFLTDTGVHERVPRIKVGTTVMAIVAWLTVISGTWIAYPWYRARPPEPIPTDPALLVDYPRYLLLAQEKTAGWHEFGMEWKEHVAWIAPFLATAVAFIALYYGVQLLRRNDMRRMVLILFTLAFAAAGVAGLFGAFITKAAPVA